MERFAARSREAGFDLGLLDPTLAQFGPDAHRSVAPPGVHADELLDEAGFAQQPLGHAGAPAGSVP